MSRPETTRTHTHLPGPGRRTPVSTYRIQLQPRFGFADARAALPVLHDLGVTDIYLSPILQAAAGSTHGYDVVDHSRISAELGGREGFETLARAAHELGMGVIVDVVPNHMAVPTPLWENRALWSVLREGPDSPYASWFDGTDDEDGILMPFLGARIGTVLAAGEITLDTMTVPGDGAESHVLRYYDHVFPVRPGTESLPMSQLIQSQFYRLAYWKVADEELNYRRFFDVDTLAALRIEDREVFDATHALLFELAHGGHIDGFRIDHPDGLADPRGYFRWIHEATGGAWVVAEKILEADEELPSDWPIAGTTGYDAAWRIGALHVDPIAAVPLTHVAQTISESSISLADEIEIAKRQIVTSSLYAEIHRIGTLAAQICHDDILLRDHTTRSLTQCLTELVIAVDQYRAYVVPGQHASAEAERVIRHAATRATERLEPDLLDTLNVVVDLVLGREVGSAGRSNEARRGELIVRFQQVCGAVTAKGIEDTAYYRWTPLVSLTDVGGAPHIFGTTPDDVHAWCSTMAPSWPASMTLLSTHDSKRSEDVRARISVISEFVPEWRQLVQKLEPLAAGVEGHTRNLLWQILAGTWDDGLISSERLTRYMIKAAREQKLWTSWTAPDEAAEAQLADVCENLVGGHGAEEDFRAWAELTAPQVRAAVLGAKATQLTCMGVADIYQGTERMQTYLVDPDNRAPLDVEGLREGLATDANRSPRTLSEEKLRLTRTILQLRRDLPEVFVGAGARYRPLAASTGHILAFARGDIPQAVTVASRLTRSVGDRGGFGDHTVVLPQGAWTDVVTGAVYDGGTRLVRDLLAECPVSVLKRTA